MSANIDGGDNGHGDGPRPDAVPEVQTETHPDSGPDARAEDSAVTPRRRTSRLARVGLPVAAGATVVAVTVGVLVAVGRPDHPDSPEVLRLVDRSQMLAATAEGRPGDSDAAVWGSRPVVSGTLPTTPNQAGVYTFAPDRAPADRVLTLARALGLSGQPEHGATGWQLRSGDLMLGVSDVPGWPWSLGPIATAVPEGPISEPPVGPVQVQTLPAPVETAPAPGEIPPTAACLAIVNGQRLCPEPTLEPKSGSAEPGVGIPERPDGTSATSVPDHSDSGPAVGAPDQAPVPDAAVGSPTAPGSIPDGVSSNSTELAPRPLPPTPAPDTIRDAARPVLTALGLADATVRVTTSPGNGLVTADPIVAGLRTDGYATTLHYDQAARLIFANGWLANPRQGARYPLATAGDTLRNLPTPVPAVMCDPCPPSADQVTVTGAELGLALRHDDRARPLLVPAWFYQVRGGDRPLVLIAVEPRFLGEPQDTPGVHTGPAGQPMDSGPANVGSAGGSAGGGSVGQPGAPAQVAPAVPPATGVGSVGSVEPVPEVTR
ncbi:MAG TPA: hypothetical protein VIR27_13580 [Mycobacteriales bacterium]